jgi:hypothetical protein
MLQYKFLNGKKVKKENATIMRLFSNNEMVIGEIVNFRELCALES